MGLSRLTVVMAALALLFAASPTMAGGPIASGHGNLTFDGGLRTFSFIAIDTGDHTAHGQMEFTNRSSGGRVHAAVDCAFVDGNAVVITAVEDAEHVWIFGARDHGEGSGAPPDELTLAFTLNPFFAGLDCAGRAFFVPILGGVNGIIDNNLGGALSIKDGNIQVH